MKMVINPEVDLGQEELGQLHLAAYMFPNYQLTGLADLHSDHVMPLWRSRKLCIKESKSRYVPHQGTKECNRRIKHASS